MIPATLRTFVLATAAVLLLPAAASAGADRVIPLTPTGHHTAVTAHVGDVVVLRLRANASTGYAWHVVSGTRRGIVRLRASEYLPGQTNLIGAPGTYVARFEALHRGRVVVKLAYRRTTTTPSPPVATFALTLTVR